MLNNNLKLIRLERNLSQEEVAYAVHVARSTYAMYESGLRCPDIQTIYNLSKYFDVPMEFLYNDDPAQYVDKINRHIIMSEEQKRLNRIFKYLTDYSRGKLLERAEMLAEGQREMIPVRITAPTPIRKFKSSQAGNS